MPYSSSVHFHGDTGTAFGLAESALTALGFRITQRSPESLEAVGPGMNSMRENPLTGASRIRFRRSPGEMAVEAELGGVERMSRFVTLFPIGLCLAIAVTFVVIFGPPVPMAAWMAPAIIALPWLVLGPWMARFIRTRTCRALEALLANMVTLGAASN
jgi:hypothetical protein